MEYVDSTAKEQAGVAFRDAGVHSACLVAELAGVRTIAPGGVYLLGLGQLLNAVRFAPKDQMELVFGITAVFACGSLWTDGETTWIEGMMLLALYAILGIGFFFLPG